MVSLSSSRILADESLVFPVLDKAAIATLSRFPSKAAADWESSDFPW